MTAETQKESNGWVSFITRKDIAETFDENRDTYDLSYAQGYRKAQYDMFVHQQAKQKE